MNRNPKKVNDTDQLMKSDLTDPNQLDEAVKGSEIVYVTIGFEYKTRVWKEKWPKFMINLIESCKKHNSKIVFVDNIYMYDPDYLGNMTEETPIRLVSEKSRIRAEIFRMLMKALEQKEVTATIHSLNAADLSTLTGASTSFGSVGFNSIFILERENGIIFFITSNPTIIFLLMRKNFRYSQTRLFISKNNFLQQSQQFLQILVAFKYFSLLG